MAKQAKLSARVRGSAAARVAALFALTLIMIASVGAQEGLSWRSYAELGGGISVSDGQFRPLATFESGLLLSPLYFITKNS
jgi:hypothetical protein